jgi:hypothetical protein
LYTQLQERKNSKNIKNKVRKSLTHLNIEATWMRKICENQFGCSEICGYERCNNPVFQPSAAHFSWDPLGNHKLDPDKPKKQLGYMIPC